ncbi:MAG: tRNA uridine-5-carboxymethylaminomethyl(34) synthesis GTPase MnmE [Magnetococcales bacterium]|nr:tRNA uridine-5-carboxymethylaminomethyl(34) synthesis GTPase MnmE [Magnetococcales bacterium]
MHTPSTTLDSELIAGLATPPGCSGVAVIRLSGPGLPHTLLPLLRHPSGQPLKPEWFKPRTLHRLDLFDPEANSLLDQALVVYFPAPHSFTGEAQMEIHSHGAPVVLTQLLTLLTRIGVRMAQPGEFSRRAYQNGKLDLTRAEALMALIHASNLRAAREAARQLQGSLGQTIGKIRESLLDLLVQTEAELDFADEEIELHSDGHLTQQLQEITQQLNPLVQGATVGQQWQNGLELVILGQPNVGKSSLYNHLVGKEKAIVTPIAGTTRDLNEHHLAIHGVPIVLVDTAGVRETAEVIEQEGIQRAKARAAQADGVLLLYDAQNGLSAIEMQWAATLGPDRLILVANKVDQCQTETMPDTTTALAGFRSLAISCRTGVGLAALTQAIYDHFAQQPAGEESPVILLARQREVIQRTKALVEEAKELLTQGKPKEIVAMVLRSSLATVAELAGETTHDQLLDRIFSQFCIGK